MRRMEGGFTLVEVMIVILVVALLAILMIPRIVRARYEDQLASCENTLVSIAAACAVYHNDHRAYPERLDAEFFKTALGEAKAPTCPSDGGPYAYKAASDGQDYVVSCQNGIHHLALKGVAPGYPQYTPARGVSRRP